MKHFAVIDKSTGRIRMHIDIEPEEEEGFGTFITDRNFDSRDMTGKTFPIVDGAVESDFSIDANGDYKLETLQADIDQRVTLGRTMEKQEEIVEFTVKRDAATILGFTELTINLQKKIDGFEAELQILEKP